MSSFTEAFVRVADLRGRTSLRSYWMFYVQCFAGAIGVMLLIAFLKLSFHLEATILLRLYVWALIIPHITAGMRRMHDIDRSSLWLLVPLVGQLFLLYPGTPGPNKYGPRPETS
jgi:uncharacterized membrane protein YhaH (DUF805 family)